MIDTVVLEVPIKNPSLQKIIESSTYGNWEPNLQTVMNAFWETKPSIKCVLNPTKAEKLSGEYQPRLTALKQVTKGGFKWFLYIEFSAQKLLFGNNYQEVNDNDFDDICQKLEKCLKAKGINLTAPQIKKTTCKRVDYAKNCLYKSNIRNTILELHKGICCPRYDVVLSQPSNGGIVLSARVKARGISFYDKNAELKKSIKSGNQPSLSTEDLKKINGKRVLRVEYQLSSKNVISHILGMARMPVSDKPTFEEVFGIKQAKAAIQSELCKIKDSWFGAMSITDTRKAKTFIDNNYKLTQPAAAELAMAGLLANQYGARETRLVYGYRWRKVEMDSRKSKFTPNPYLEGVIKKIDDFDIIRVI